MDVCGHESFSYDPRSVLYRPREINNGGRSLASQTTPTIWRWCSHQRKLLRTMHIASESAWAGPLLAYGLLGIILDSCIYSSKSRWAETLCVSLCPCTLWVQGWGWPSWSVHHDKRGCLSLVWLEVGWSATRSFTSALCEPLMPVHFSRPEWQGAGTPSFLRTGCVTVLCVSLNLIWDLLSVLGTT